MATITKPLAELKPRYDVVIVGSGYGGGVAASRLARAGLSVCVLERGRVHRPGDFGNTLQDFAAELQFTGQRLRSGRRDALFDMRSGPDLNILVACGLGGGSLINAGIALRPEPDTLRGAAWPAVLADCPHLRTGFDRAERMLGVSPHPTPEKFAKFRALQKGAAAVGAEAVPAPAAISWETRANRANVVQHACVHCGDCWSGCNVGAKHTVASTYLPDAHHFGADIFTGAGVRRFAKEEDGGGRWRIEFGYRQADGSGATGVVRADRLILAGGVLGSTELLLRSRAQGLALSARLGQGLSANGDDLAVGFNTAWEMNAVAVGVPARAALEPGPNCVGAARVKTQDGAEILVQDGAMWPLMARTAPLKVLLRGKPVTALRTLLGGIFGGVQRNSGPFYVVGHDSAGGSLRLDGKRLRVEWPGLAGESAYKRTEEVMGRLIAALEGEFVRNPLADKILGGRRITVHPLGGCPMGEDAARGVVNHKGEVFDASRQDGGVHEGLYVCDGAVVPSSLGVNPLLTITALAERMMILLAEDCGLHFDDEPARDAPLYDVTDVN